MLVCSATSPQQQSPSPATIAFNLYTMELINQLLRVFLALWLLKQANTQTVTVTIGEFDSKVFIEWYGSVTDLPAPYISAIFSLNFYSSGKDIDVHTGSSAANCKYCTGFCFNGCACKIACRSGHASYDPLCGFLGCLIKLTIGTHCLACYDFSGYCTYCYRLSTSRP